MQLKNFILAASAAATASAAAIAPHAACPSPIPSNQTTTAFGLVAINANSAVQYKPFNAALGAIFAGLKAPNATCDRASNQTDATFYLKDGALYLYSTSATPQEIFVDASGMGQGVIGYTTGAQPAPLNSLRTGWTINSENHLQWRAKDLIACPNSIGGAWSIWADAGYANPAFNTNCTSIAARVMETSKPNSCLYTVSP